MKTTIFLIVLFFISTFYMQSQDQEIRVTLAAGIDTTNNKDKKDVFVLWNDYLNSNPDSTYNNPYWNKFEKMEFKSFDLLNHSGYLSPSLHGLCKRGAENVILSIAPKGEYYEIKSLFYFPYPDKTIYPLAEVNYLAKKENGKYKLYNFSPFYTRNWYKKPVGYFKYIYHPNHPFDLYKAKEANDYYLKLSKVFDFKQDTITYYIAENCDKIFNLQGFDFVVGIGKDNNVCGFYDYANSIIYSNSIAGENYKHEIAHKVLQKFPESGVFHLGVVTYWGGENAHFNHSLNYHIKRINQYLKNHKEIDLGNFMEDFSQLDEYTSPHYIIAAIFCHLALEKGGVDKLKKLLSYGNENTYLAIEKEIGVKKKDLNTFLRNKIDFYAKNGITQIPI